MVVLFLVSSAVVISELPLWAIGAIVGAIAAVLLVLFIAGVITVIVKSRRLSTSEKIKSVDRERSHPPDALSKLTDKKELVNNEEEEM